VDYWKNNWTRINEAQASSGANVIATHGS
jgi:hypothetical protein